MKGCSGVIFRTFSKSRVALLRPHRLCEQRSSSARSRCSGKSQLSGALRSSKFARSLVGNLIVTAQMSAFFFVFGDGISVRVTFPMRCEFWKSKWNCFFATAASKPSVKTTAVLVNLEWMMCKELPYKSFKGKIALKIAVVSFIVRMLTSIIFT